MNSSITAKEIDKRPRSYGRGRSSPAAPDVNAGGEEQLPLMAKPAFDPAQKYV
jgi:hypothetical protein